MRKLIGLVTVVSATLCLVGAAPGATRPEQLPLGTVNIAGTTYAWFDGLAFARRYAPTPALRTIVAVARACRNFTVYGFISLRGAGIVGRAPTSLAGCLPVVGGGPGAAGCLQAKRTPYPDPYGLSRLQLSRDYVLIAATTDRTCRDLSTQVPGVSGRRRTGRSTACPPAASG
jgi:hypothetical protein